MKTLSSKPSSQVGFTLIELMIVVAVVGVLSAVAYPSYLDHVRKSRRADAQSYLMNVASRQQQYILDTRAYAATTAALNVSATTAVTAYYTIAVVTGSATVPSFTVSATPLGTQAQDKCGTLTLTETGSKSPANCW